MKLVYLNAPDEPPPTPETVLKHLEALDVLRAAGEGGKLLSLHRLWRQRVNERAAEAQDDRAGLLDALEALGEDRGWAAHDALVDQDLAWELAPLEGLSTVLYGADRVRAAVGVANLVHTPLHELARYVEVEALLGGYVADEARIGPAVGEETYASLLSNLAATVQARGDLAGARALLERAIGFWEIGLDKGHPDLATGCSNLATILHQQGDLTGARALMERAVHIDERNCFEDDPTLAIRYSNLGLILKDQGDLSGARARMERAIQIFEKHYDPDHPRFAVFIHNLAWVLWSQGRGAEAIERMERAVAIVAKHFTPEHPHRKTAELGLARMRAELNP